MPKLTLEQFLQTYNLVDLLRELGVENVNLLAKEISHFTENEAERRDRIVLSYFGKEGIERIVDLIVTRLTSTPRLKPTAKILDMGAGTGLFTVKVAAKIRKLTPHASFYAMDATPAMLLALKKKKEHVIPFFGIAENIQGSANIARRYVTIPKRFDAVFSTLMLHHCPDINKVFKSVRQVLIPSGKAAIIDLCAHTFTEFRDEMGDVHLGFEPAQIERSARKAFSKVKVEHLPGICCSSSGRSAELFVATMKA